MVSIVKTKKKIIIINCQKSKSFLLQIFERKFALELHIFEQQQPRDFLIRRGSHSIIYRFRNCNFLTFSRVFELYRVVCVIRLIYIWSVHLLLLWHFVHEYLRRR